MKKLILLIWFSGMCLNGFAQEQAVQQSIEDLLESAGENLSDETDFQEILEDLESFRQNPLNVNVAKPEELGKLHVLTELQIASLLAFREKTGTILSLFELAAVDGFTPDVLMKIEPFLTFGMPDKLIGRKRVSNDLFLRSTRSFSSSAQSENYEGSPERIYVRLKHTAAKFEYGIVAEKDPGESFFRYSNNHGFDYNNAFVNFRIGKKGDRFFAGAHQVHFGQGLVAWQGFSMGKSVETTQIFKSNPGIRSFASTDENQFFRGVAGQFKSGRFSFYPFISRSRIDAHIDTIDGKAVFSAFQVGGYHRTGSEISGENALGQTVGGAHLNCSIKNWSFGLTGIYTSFNAEIDRGDEPYNQFLPDGKESLVAGFDWKGSVKNVFFFGEAAASQNSGKAFLSGMMFKPASNAELSVVYRNINKTYWSYFSNAFTESSRTNDEHGFYLGIKLFPAAHWILNGYADLFRYKWIKHTTSAPSEGTEYFVQATFSPSRETSFYLRFFQEEKGQRLITDQNRYDVPQLTRRLRFNFVRNLSEQLNLKSRIEFSSYSKQSNEKGYLVFQDVGFKPREKSFAMNGRLAYFKTDGYFSRLYAYESDLLYAFSVPALYGHGIRAYFNFRQQVGGKFTVWLKLASTYNFAVNNEVQSIPTATKSELKIQIRYQF
ncbi:MAG: helix-hairpin-helix domain-containing protein [Prolixibacteraceae bacterium]